MTDLFALTFDALQQKHAVVLAVGEALLLAPGAAPQHPADAARQRIAAGTYPWPRRRLPGAASECVLLADIAAVLAGLVGEAGGSEDAAPAPRRPGRPRKNAAPQHRGTK